VLANLAGIGADTVASVGEQDMTRHLNAALERAMTESGAPGAIAGVWKGDFGKQRGQSYTFDKKQDSVKSVSDLHGVSPARSFKT